MAVNSTSAATSSTSRTFIVTGVAGSSPIISRYAPSRAITRTSRPSAVQAGVPTTTSTQAGSVSSQMTFVVPSSATASTCIVRWFRDATRSSAGPPADQCTLIRYGSAAVSQFTGVSAPSSPASTTLTSAFAVPAAG